MPENLSTFDFNDENSNVSDNPRFEKIFEERLSRRQWLGHAAAGAALGLTSHAGLAAASNAPVKVRVTAKTWPPIVELKFNSVAKSLEDKVQVATGYRYQVLYALGDPLDSQTPDFKNDGSDTGFERRAGDHHDGMEWFGLDAMGRPSTRSVNRGVLAVNHEATTDEKLTSFFIHPTGGQPSLPRLASEVDKEVALHGLSVVEILTDSSIWRYDRNSLLNRRVTPLSPAQLMGPARGSAHVITRYSPDGLNSRGTLNNCGAGKTPWGTYLSGEENWTGYFFRDGQDDERRGATSPEVIALRRYGRPAGAASRHGWETAGVQESYSRWNINASASAPQDDYRNEINTFGYIVEMDPYHPQTSIRKRTALGRMAHENVCFARPLAGQPLVAFMGDDSRNEYIYKFVSEARWDPKDAEPVDRLAIGDKYLDRGTLHVARFNPDGTGDWIELSLNNPRVANSALFPFKTAADIAVYTRIAADLVQATKMDRPEWGGISPRTGELYITLTNNSSRNASNVDAANPRAYTDFKNDRAQKGNVNGHIVRIGHRRPTDTQFSWDIYLFGSEALADAAQINLSNLSDENDFSSPDGLVFSPATGICWIGTDDSAYADKTNCMLLAAIPGRVGDGSSHTLNYSENTTEKSVKAHIGKPATSLSVKRFLVGPRDCEITGCCETPDGKALFINIQHPGEATPMAAVLDPSRYTSQWPSNAGYGAGSRPRSATIVITKEDGGVIGS
jgi:uncharacterized protein